MPTFNLFFLLPIISEEGGLLDQRIIYRRYRHGRTDAPA